MQSAEGEREKEVPQAIRAMQDKDQSIDPKTPVVGTSMSFSISKMVPILGRKNSKPMESPCNSQTRSSSVSSLGLVENYDRARLRPYGSTEPLALVSSSSDEEDEFADDPDDIRQMQQAKSDTSRYKRSFEEVFRMDSLASPSSSSKTNTSDDEQVYGVMTPKKSPNVFFKKFMSKSVLKPQPKSFKRVSNELQLESQPLQTELANEAAVTWHLKDEEMLLESRRVFNNQTQMQNETLKKYEAVNRANKLWSHSNFTKALANAATKPLTTMTMTNNEFTNNHDSKKRKSIDTDTDNDRGVDPYDHSTVKRRVVSTSPNLGSVSPMIPASRRNSKLMQSTSDDLEKMSI